MEEKTMDVHIGCTTYSVSLKVDDQTRIHCVGVISFEKQWNEEWR